MTPLRLQPDDCVNKDGWMSPWGTIKILRRYLNVSDGQWKGAEYWSNDWAHLRQGSYRARKADDQSGLWVIDEFGRDAQFVPCSDIYLVTSRRFRAHSVFVGLTYLFREDEPQPNLERCLKALTEAATGQPLSHTDNEPFIQVPLEFEDVMLMVVAFDCSDRRLVFTETGDAVDCQIVYPLRVQQELRIEN